MCQAYCLTEARPFIHSFIFSANIYSVPMYQPLLQMLGIRQPNLSIIARERIFTYLEISFT